MPQEPQKGALQRLYALSVLEAKLAQEVRDKRREHASTQRELSRHIEAMRKGGA